MTIVTSKYGAPTWEAFDHHALLPLAAHILCLSLLYRAALFGSMDLSQPPTLLPARVGTHFAQRRRLG